MVVMKSRLVALFLCASLVCAVQARATTLPDACGDDKVKFDVKTQAGQSAPAPPADGKAQIVFIETMDEENLAFCKGCDVVARLGVDGAWVGANKGNSYFAYTVEPGEHHLCTNWDSPRAFLSEKVGVADFTAEPGKTYYFQARFLIKMVDIDTAQLEQRLELTQLSDDEGKYRVKVSPLSTGNPKK